MFEREIQDHIEATMLRLAEAREIACEAALQSGLYGVLETWHPDGSITFEVSHRVPYGQIHEQHLL